MQDAVLCIYKAIRGYHDSKNEENLDELTLIQNSGIHGADRRSMVDLAKHCTPFYVTCRKRQTLSAYTKLSDQTLSLFKLSKDITG